MKFYTYIKVLLIWAAILSPVWLNSQANSIAGLPFIKNYTRMAYSGQTQNWDIEQDKNGFIYVANNEGLLRYDGTTWSNIPLPNNSVVRSILITDDKIYVGGQDEFGYMDWDHSGHQSYNSLTHLIPETHKSFEDVWKIIEINDGLYFCSQKVIFRYANEKIDVVSKDNIRWNNFFEFNGRLLAQDAKGSVHEIKGTYINTYENGLISIPDRIVAILPHVQYNKLILTEEQGIFYINEEKLDQWNNESSSYLKKHKAYSGIKMANGQYAFGTTQNGIITCDQNGKISNYLNKSNGLQNNTILTLFQDQQFNIWAGLDNGIDYISLASPYRKLSTNLGIDGTGYCSLQEGRKSYLGTNQGLFIGDLNAKNDSNFRLIENSNGQVWNISKVGNQIIVCHHKGTFYIENDRLIKISDIQGAWKFMELTSKPGFALCGNYTGLYLYKDLNFTKREKNPELKARWTFIGKVKGFDESARIFEEDSDGHIWVSHTYKGLYKLDISTTLDKVNQVKKYTNSNGLPNGLLINVVKLNGMLFFTTNKGVFEYVAEKDQFFESEEFEQILGPRKAFQKVIQDNSSDLWYIRDDSFGLVKMIKNGMRQDFEVSNFNQLKKWLVQGYEHVNRLDNNRVLVGAEDGFISIDLEQSIDTTSTFNTIITSAALTTKKDSIIYHTGQDRASYDFVYHANENDFKFSFTAPNFMNSGNVLYRYKLQGFQEDWSDWDYKTEKEFTNLKPGSYTFQVQSRDSNSSQGSIDTFSFQIKRPFYYSWWAKMVYGFLSVVLLSSIIRYISKREEKVTLALEQKQNEELEQQQAAFQKEVEKSENEIIKLRNEKLHDDIKHKNSQLASATMHLVQKSEILMKIKSDLEKIDNIKNPEVKKQIKKIKRTITSDIQLDESWKQFEMMFDQVHENFFKRLRTKHPNLTPKDQKLCAYLRMNLSTKEIAPLLNISVRGVEVSRYRLRKKLDLSSDVNLVAFMLQI